MEKEDSIDSKDNEEENEQQSKEVNFNKPIQIFSHNILVKKVKKQLNSQYNLISIT